MSSAESTPVSKAAFWTGLVIQALVVLFLLFDAITKIIEIAPVMQAFARLGYPTRLAPVIGTILLIAVIIYIIPQTSMLGAILLAAYLGGAVEVNLRAGDPVFETIFPVIFGVLVWAAIYLRDPRLRKLIPLRNPS